MPNALLTNRTMFWRIVRRLVFAHRARLVVILLALGAGAAVTAALLNLQIDAKRRLSSEFRAFGANALVTPRAAGSQAFGAGSSTLEGSLYERIPNENGSDPVAKASLLYGIADAAPWNERTESSDSTRAIPVVATGISLFGHDFAAIFPSSIVAEPRGMAVKGFAPGSRFSNCELGEQVAKRLRVQPEQFVELRQNGASTICHVRGIRRFGGPEDNQIFLPLDSAEALFHQVHRISLIALNVPGAPADIQRYLSALEQSMPEADIRPIRQFTEAQAKIYNRISGLLNYTVILILILTGLCVMAAMANVAVERKNDVGLMKAIGGAKRRVLRLFLAEATLLGLAGGLIGAAAGLGLSIYLGKAVFGLAARPRLIVYPVSVALTMIVAVLSAFPLRRLAGIRPASVFRGEA